MNNIFYIQISILSIFIANILYGWSLEGKKDVDWIHHHIGIFGVYIFTASILYFTGFFIFVLLCFTDFYNKNNIKTATSDGSSNRFGRLFNNIDRRVIILMAALCTFVTLFQLLSDTGATLEHHGQYNLIILVGIELLYTSIALFWIISLKFFKFKNICIALIIFGIFVGSVFQTYKAESIKQWPVGISGRKMMFSGDKGECTIIKDFTPWPDFIPKGFTKALVGTQECPKEVPFSYLTNDNMLHIECSGDSAEYTQSPNFFTAIRDAGNLGHEIEPLVDKYAPFERTNSYGSEPIKVLDETVVTKCGAKTEVLMQNVRKEVVHERASHFVDSDRPNFQKASTTTKPINVLFLMVDALSRAHFKRALPKTYKAVQKIQDGGVATVFQFMRYHSLKPYTDPNTIAMYTGYNALTYSAHDAKLASMPHPRHDWKRNPMYFQSYRNDSYTTAWVYGFCEDWFQAYLSKPKPVDSVDHELVLPFCSPEAYPPDRPFGNFAGPFSFKRRCLGNKHIHERIFDYINQYWDNYADVGKIVHATFMDAHEGTMDVIKYADDGFSKFIGEDMVERMNDTMLVLVGDHGSHMGPYYLWAPGGQVEVAMPTLYFTMPNWFLEAHPEVAVNFMANENKLSTPFQLYDTLRTLATYPEFGGIDAMDPNKERNDQKRGFLGEIKDDIQCSDLGIPYDFCQCHS